MAGTDLKLIELEFTDSTNNYAMQLINDDKAQPGTTIVARSQGGGKGQRGRKWTDTPGESLLMSVIVAPKQQLTEQFVFSASVAVAIANVLQNMTGVNTVSIKWPNDIIINDKKAGGILIENVLRGSNWTHSVIGFGLNVNQTEFPDDLANATSLFMSTGKIFEVNALARQIGEHILATTLFPKSAQRMMENYNELLYRKGMMQQFEENGTIREAKITGVNADGGIELRFASATRSESYHHGQINWVW
ncbi:MAG: biotin--[acetyl-CoA-carboxylase] ligase [Chitinophagaceae bacterium]|nr:biotin--[acetyl-CoA-carboxylase] ligase [Chitinophagaceae bacterium]